MYIKVTPSVADALGVKGIRNTTADGNYLLWQGDVNIVPGLSIEDRASKIGGVALSPNQAKMEIDGTDAPFPVVDPFISNPESVKFIEKTEE